jgi:predicted molibdopterin-dependent oxidoreductase YjgC
MKSARHRERKGDTRLQIFAIFAKYGKDAKQLVPPVHVTDTVPVGTVFSTFDSSEINVLTNDSLDPVCKVPELKMCAVTIEKVA